MAILLPSTQPCLRKRRSNAPTNPLHALCVVEPRKPTVAGLAQLRWMVNPLDAIISLPRRRRGRLLAAAELKMRAIVRGPGGSIVKTPDLPKSGYAASIIAAIAARRQRA